MGCTSWRRQHLQRIVNVFAFFYLLWHLASVRLEKEAKCSFLLPSLFSSSLLTARTSHHERRVEACQKEMALAGMLLYLPRAATVRLPSFKLKEEEIWSWQSRRWSYAKCSKMFYKTMAVWVRLYVLHFCVIITADFVCQSSLFFSPLPLSCNLCWHAACYRDSLSAFILSVRTPCCQFLFLFLCHAPTLPATVNTHYSTKHIFICHWK